MMTLSEFLREYGISMTAERTSKNPNRDSDGMQHHYRVTLLRGFPKHGPKTQMTTYYSMGSALRNWPATDDVLDCLASEAAGFENARDFEDWCSEYGYDDDSSRAKRTYKAVAQNTKALRRFLGDDGYELLLWDVERQ